MVKNDSRGCKAHLGLALARPLRREVENRLDQLHKEAGYSLLSILKADFKFVLFSDITGRFSNLNI